ncbi:MAG: sulfatase-like hydrolase/transferase [Bacillota bacterium]
MRKPKCVYVFQFDEVRADHLSVNGYYRRQKNIEALAREGVVFATVISGSSYTGAATPVLWTGMIGPHTGVRDPFHVVCPPLLQEYIKKYLGWATQGCMSQSVAGSGIGMNNGFDIFIEPTDPNAPDTWGDGVEHWQALGVNVDGRFHAKPVGKRYVDDNIRFIKQCAAEGKSFYLYNQFYETHTGSEEYLVRSGRIKEGEMPENAYYDAKIKLADEEVIGSVIATLKEVGYYDDALIVITGDHGTTLRNECWPFGDYIYDPVDLGDLPNTHSSLYDVDLKIPLIIKAPNLPPQCIGKRIEGQVRSIDIMPTIMDLLGILDKVEVPLDGESLVPCMEKLRGHGKRAYAETVWSVYGMGARQALREENWKYIRYASSMYEEFFDLKKDPLEQNNLIDRLKFHAPKWLQQLREQCNDYYRAEPKGIVRREMPEEEKKAIEARLRALGYIVE